MFLESLGWLQHHTRMPLARIGRATAVWLLAAPVILGGGATSAAVPDPIVSGPIVDGCSPVCPVPPGPVSGTHIPDLFGGQSTNPDLATYDYVESEYFFEGLATAFERDPTAAAWTTAGDWTARPSTTIPQAFFRSRMQVLEPANPADFNGTVIVEWLNVTAGLDTPPDYAYAHELLLRDGYIWVGVSSQSVGVNGGFFPPRLRAQDLGSGALRNAGTSG